MGRRAAVEHQPVVHLDEDGVTDASLGGKGAWLRRLQLLGISVPPTVVVPTSVYEVVAADARVHALLTRLRGGEVVSAEVVDAAFLDADLPSATARDLVNAAHEVCGSGRLAVRSSASVEDMPGRSFAGQYRSFLDVHPDTGLIEAVRLTWASLWHPAPCAYRLAWGVPDDHIAMAVVIQAMVAAERAGVVFTVAPGDPDHMRIEVVDGLGESLVSGDETPGVLIVDRDPSRAPPLHPGLDVVRLRAVALEIEQGLGSPQDIEWAWAGDQLWIVQSRPITTLGPVGDPFDSPPTDHELTTAGIGEMLPGVLPPLQWQTAAYVIEEAFRSVFDQLAGLANDVVGSVAFVHRVHGRAALDLDLVKAVAQRVPGASVAELEKRYFGVLARSTDARSSDVGRLRTAVSRSRAGIARRRSVLDAEILVRTAEVIGDRPDDLASLPDDELLARRTRLVDLGARMAAVEVLVSAAATAAFTQLEQTLGLHLGPEDGARWAQMVTRSGSVRPPEDQSSSAVFAGPTWDEVGGVARIDAGTSEGSAQPPFVQLAEHLRDSPAWRRRRFLAGHVVDVRMHLVRRLATDAAEGLRRREEVKAALLAVGGVVRRIDLDVGRRLCDRGVLTPPSDVELLAVAELAPALGGIAIPPAELAQRRRWRRRWTDEPSLPVRFTGEPVRAEVATPSGGRVLEGWAASPGRSSGTARVVTRPLVDTFEAGEVLVAEATDASWTPLLVKAAAVVVERGGPLSHASIVARELAIPAVMNVAAATQVMGGRHVTVDGDAGLVIIDDGPSD